MEKETVISDIVPNFYKDRAKQLGDDHVKWLWKVLSPLMYEEFVHGYRHGWEDAKNDEKELDMSWLNKLAKVELREKEKEPGSCGWSKAINENGLNNEDN